MYFKHTKKIANLFENTTWTDKWIDIWWKTIFLKNLVNEANI